MLCADGQHSQQCSAQGQGKGETDRDRDREGRGMDRDRYRDGEDRERKGQAGRGAGREMIAISLICSEFNLNYSSSFVPSHVMLCHVISSHLSLHLITWIALHQSVRRYTSTLHSHSHAQSRITSKYNNSTVKHSIVQYSAAQFSTYWIRACQTSSSQVQLT